MSTAGAAPVTTEWKAGRSASSGDGKSAADASEAGQPAVHDRAEGAGFSRNTTSTTYCLGTPHDVTPAFPVFGERGRSSRGLPTAVLVLRHGIAVALIRE